VLLIIFLHFVAINIAVIRNDFSNADLPLRNGLTENAGHEIDGHEIDIYISFKK